MKNVLIAINDLMKELGLTYSYMLYKPNGDPKYPYWVGSLMESESMTEDGYQGATFTLSGFARGMTWLDFEDEKTKIFNKIKDGYTQIVNGYCVDINYMYAVSLQEEDNALKRYEIMLNIRTWRNN